MTDSAITARLEDWGIVEGKHQVFGNVFDDTSGRFADGQYIKVTPTAKPLHLFEEGDTVETQNSTYLLGKRQPDYDAKIENWHKLWYGGVILVYGNIKGDKKGRFHDGDYIHTSAVVEGELKEWNVIRTRNSTYLLCNAHSE